MFESYTDNLFLYKLYIDNLWCLCAIVKVRLEGIWIWVPALVKHEFSF